MNAPFFITGLPMSRTSWLANLFTTGGVMCHHDLLTRVDGVEALAARLESERSRLGWRALGDSDSGLLWVYPVLHARFPEARWVLVQRDFEDAWESLCRFVGEGPWKDRLCCSWELRETLRRQWEEVAPRLIENPRCMTVPYESLERTDQIECVWRHCLPGVKFGEQERARAEALQRLQVRPMQSKCPARAEWNLVNEVRKLWPQEQSLAR